MINAKTRMQRDIAGFSLVEIIVVLAIIAALASLALPAATSQAKGRYQLESATRELINMLRVARAAAVLRGKDINVTIDLDKHTFQSSGQPPRSYSSSISARLKAAEPETASKTRAGIRFLPDGSSTGGEVTLVSSGAVSTVCVNWLTGQSRLATSC